MRKLPTVGEHMDKRVYTVSPNMPIGEAVDLLLRRHVTGAPVVDEGGRLIGIVTAKDCLRVLTLGENVDSPGKVSDYMTTEVVTIPPTMDIYYVAGLFLKSNFRRLPVVEENRLVGAITRYDLLRVIKAYLKRSQ